MSFYAYMLKCRDGSYYTGHSDNIEARLAAHRDGLLPGYTRTRRPVQLVWYQDCPSRDEAFAAERRIKGWSRAKKEALLRADWSSLVALAAIRANDRKAGQPAAAAHPSRASG